MGPPEDATTDASPSPGILNPGGEADNQKSRNRRRGFRKPAGTPRPILRQPKFEGKCEELKGHIYDCSDTRQSDTFIKTTKEIAEYVGRTFKKGSDARLAIENLVLPTLTVPTAPDDETDRTLVKIWEKEIDEYVKRKICLADNMQTVYSLVWGQCTDIMRQKIEALPIYSTLTTKGDGLALLKAIKNLVYNFQSQKYLSQALHESTRRFYFCAQGRHTTTSEYMEKFQNMVDVIEHSGGSVGHQPGILEEVADGKKIDLKTASNDDIAELKKTAQEQYLATAFLLSSDRGRYGRLLEDLENDFLQVQDHWPKTLTAAFNLLTNWKHNTIRNADQLSDGVSFLNADEQDEEPTDTALTTDGTKKSGYQGKNFDKSKVTCHRCGKKGHYAPECDQAREQARQTGEQLLMDGANHGEFDQGDNLGFQFQQGDGNRIPKSWILLDNQSTVDVFHNADLLTNIRQGDGYMDIHCNAGMTSTNLVGDLPGYGEVWYNPNGIANILSLCRVKERGFRVAYDSNTGNAFHVHKPDGTKRVFQQSKRGLYYMDTATTGITLVNTVEDNKSNFSNIDYSRALLARKVQKMIGRPSNRTFLKIIDNKLLPNCPVTRRDIAIATAIFGPDIGSLKGKTVRQGGTHVEATLTDIPASIMTHYRDLVVCGDIMFVNKIPFMMTISRHLKFGTAEMLKNQKDPALLASIKQVNRIYAKRGFRIRHLLMDGQFESL